MTDPDLSPEEQAVRRLLAEARHDDPVPPEVAARLDDTLAALVAERAGADSGDAPAEPLSLAAARRRRRAASFVLAAAAVVVTGVGVSSVLRPASDDSASVADHDAALPEAGATSERSRSPRPRAAVHLSRDTLRADLRDLQEGLGRINATGSSTLPCVVPVRPADHPVAMRLDGTEGVAVFRAPSSTTQRVDLFVCGTGEPVRTVRLPAP